MKTVADGKWDVTVDVPMMSWNAGGHETCRAPVALHLRARHLAGPRLGDGRAAGELDDAEAGATLSIRRT